MGVLGFEFEELDHVVKEGEEDDGEDVAKTIPNTALIRMIVFFLILTFGQNLIWKVKKLRLSNWNISEKGK